MAPEFAAPEPHVEVMDLEAWHRRQVFAALGVAVYFCQLFEASLEDYVSMLRLLKLERPMTEAEVDALQARLRSNTLGRHLSEVVDLVGAEWKYAPEVADLVNVRNDLVHHYMRDRVREMETSAGRAGMVDELEAKRQRGSKPGTMYCGNGSCSCSNGSA